MKRGTLQYAAAPPLDRVVVRTKRGEGMAKILQRQTAKTLEVALFKDQELML